MDPQIPVPDPMQGIQHAAGAPGTPAVDPALVATIVQSVMSLVPGLLAATAPAQTPAAAHVPAAAPRTLPTPALFNNTNPDYSAEDFVGRAEEYFLLWDQPGQTTERKLLLVKSWMDGEPRRWFSDLLTSTEAPTTLEDALARVRLRYEPPVSRPELVLQLSRLRQATNESVTAFADRLRRLVDMCRRHDIMIGTDEEMRRFFGGLSNAIAQRVALHEPFPETRDELVHLAVMMETHGRAINQAERPRERTYEAMIVDGLRLPRDQLRREGRCFRCGEKGHLIKDCVQPVVAAATGPQIKNIDNYADAAKRKRKQKRKEKKKDRTPPVVSASSFPVVYGSDDFFDSDSDSSSIASTGSDTPRAHPIPAPEVPPADLDLSPAPTDVTADPDAAPPTLPLVVNEAPNADAPAPDALESTSAGPTTTAPVAEESNREEVVTDAKTDKQMGTSDTTFSVDGRLMMISVQLRFARKRRLNAIAMIDSGCASSFVSRRFAERHHIPLRRLPSPVEAEAIDGRRVAPVTHKTVPLKLVVNSCTYTMSLHVLDCPHADIVLGYPWLRSTNPTINWAAGTMTLAPQQPLVVSAAVPAKTIPKAYAKFAHVFEKAKADELPAHGPHDCAITLEPGARINLGPIYNMSLDEQKALREYIDENLKKGFIRRSKSPMGSPVLFVGKKDGSRRFCVDFRRLNAVTVRDAYPLPLMSSMLDRLSKGRIFTKIDLRNAYNLIRIREGDEYKTAFRTQLGQYEYLVMPFGLCNAPATFQRMINDVFSDMLEVSVVCYLDDILVFSANEKDHERDVAEVLARLEKAQLYAKLEKCEFHVKSVEFVGFIVSAEGVSMAADKVQAIRDWQPPKNVKGVQRFLGFANFYRQFIKNFSSIAAPLTELTKKGVPFVWSPAVDAAFKAVKEAFLSGGVLVHADYEAPFFVETDASDFALGAILSQREATNNSLRPIAFHSRKLLPAERNYDVHDKELLAIIDAFKIWRHYLVSSRHVVTVFSDHRNLQYFTESRTLNSRQSRWAQFLSNFQWKIVYRPGQEQVKSDALSRRDELMPEEGCEAVVPPLIRPEQLVVASAAIPSLSSSSASPSSSAPTPTTAARPPPEELLRLLREHHDQPLAGHFGVTKTLDLLRRTCMWPGMRKDVEDYVRSCDTCARAKPTRHAPYGELMPLAIPDRPWGSISLDLITDLPPARSYDSILVVVDRLTKMAHFIPTTKTLSSEGAADLLLAHVVRLHGLPDSVVSDRGPQFASRFWKRLLGLLGATANLSSGYHPQSNGQTERTNQVLEQYLRCYVDYDQGNWCDLLPLAEFAYNNAKQESTGMTPFFANSGVHPRFSFASPGAAINPAAEERAAMLKELREHLVANLEKAREAYKRKADAHRTLAPDFAVGTEVYLRRAHMRTSRPSDKLDHKYLGPFKVKRVVNTAAVELELPATMRIHPVFHVSQLEPRRVSSIVGRAVLPPPPVEIAGVEEYEVARILDSRKVGRGVQYLVAWVGYPEGEATWQPAADVTNALELVKAFHEAHPAKPITPTMRKALEGV